MCVEGILCGNGLHAGSSTALRRSPPTFCTRNAFRVGIMCGGSLDCAQTEAPTHKADSRGRLSLQKNKLRAVRRKWVSCAEVCGFPKKESFGKIGSIFCQNCLFGNFSKNPNSDFSLKKAQLLANDGKSHAFAHLAERRYS